MQGTYREFVLSLLALHMSFWCAPTGGDNYMSRRTNLNNDSA
jgi:hypothetical protein